MARNCLAKLRLRLCREKRQLGAVETAAFSAKQHSGKKQDDICMASLLKVDELRVEFALYGSARVRALRGVHLQIEPGICYGILGESGSGKSTLAKAVMQLLPKSAKITQGSIEFNGRDVSKLTTSELQNYHGKEVAFVPQEPGLALNPVMKVGEQIAEVLRAHNAWPRRRYRSEAESLLDTVRLTATDRSIYNAYPHQLSGGQQQRVAIAQALSCNPQLIIADEPTASLDAETEAEILQLLADLKSKRRMALILITHDPRILSALADRVAVLYAGRVIEDVPAEVFFNNPQHPYSRALLACAAAPFQDSQQPDSQRDSQSVAPHRLPTIPGDSPDPELTQPGCEFAPRCDRRMSKCDSQPPSPVSVSEDRRIECHLYAD
jgi:peptide/nickel transport system ATP-binding protein